jgi:lipoate-protein ligase A
LITSYQKISRLLAQGLASLGREVTLTQDKHMGLGDLHCFSAPSLAELIFQGKKVAGGAQARRGDVFLQQGVLLLSVAEEWKKAFPGAGLDNMRGLNDENSFPAVTGEQLEKKLTEAFESNGVHFEKVLTQALPSLKL